MLQPQPGRRRREENREERKQRTRERKENSARRDRGTRGHLQLLCDFTAGKGTEKWLSLKQVMSLRSSPAEQITSAQQHIQGRMDWHPGASWRKIRPVPDVRTITPGRHIPRISSVLSLHPRDVQP